MCMMGFPVLFSPLSARSLRALPPTETSYADIPMTGHVGVLSVIEFGMDPHLQWVEWGDSHLANTTVAQLCGIQGDRVSRE